MEDKITSPYILKDLVDYANYVFLFAPHKYEDVLKYICDTHTIDNHNIDYEKFSQLCKLVRQQQDIERGL